MTVDLPAARPLEPRRRGPQRAGERAGKRQLRGRRLALAAAEALRCVRQPLGQDLLLCLGTLIVTTIEARPGAGRGCCGGCGVRRRQAAPLARDDGGVRRGRRGRGGGGNGV